MGTTAQAFNGVSNTTLKTTNTQIALANQFNAIAKTQQLIANKIDQVRNSSTNSNNMGAKTLESWRAFNKKNHINVKTHFYHMYNDIRSLEKPFDQEFWSNVKRPNLKIGYHVTGDIIMASSVDKKDRDGKINIYKNSEISNIDRPDKYFGDYEITLHKDHVELLVDPHFNVENKYSVREHETVIKLDGHLDFRNGLDDLYFVPKGGSFEKDRQPINPMIEKAIKVAQQQQKVKRAEDDAKRAVEKKKDAAKKTCANFLGIFCTGR